MAKAKSSAKKTKILWRFILLIVLAAVFAVSFLWAAQINSVLGLTKIDETGVFGGNSTQEVIGLSQNSDKSLTVHFVDVGQGDACVIELPDNKKVLIDGGKDKEKNKLLKYIDETIDPQDSMLNSKKSGGYGFDYVILTHADEDHCGGIDDVLQLYGTKDFYRPNELASYKSYTDPGKPNLAAPYSEQGTLAYMNAIEAGYKNSAAQIINGNDCTIKSDSGVPAAEQYSIEFYSPTKSEYKDRNDYSPIIILTYQEKRFALSGDAEKEAEQIFVQNAQKKEEDKYRVFTDDFFVNVIKPGHHGSRTSSSSGYLETITTPASTKDVLVVISCGFGNSYGHPHIETMNRLKEMGFSDSNILRTDTNSSIVLSVAQVNGIFELLYGANVVRVETAAVPIAGPVNLQWIELCITVWALLALVLIIQPFIKKNRSKIKKATGVDIKNYAPDTSKSFEKIDDTIKTAVNVKIKRENAQDEREERMSFNDAFAEKGVPTGTKKKTGSATNGKRTSSSEIFKSIAATADKKKTSKTGSSKTTSTKSATSKTGAPKASSTKTTKKKSDN